MKIQMYAKMAIKTGLLAGGFFWALGLTAPTRRIRQAILSNTGLGV